MKIDASLLLKALKLAQEAHNGQVRRVTNDPYFTHPLAVSYIVSAHYSGKGKTDMIIAALLHDVIEDCDIKIEKIREEFGGGVASLVLELTSDPREVERIGKADYLREKMKRMTSRALIIKLSDRLHNISDNPSVKVLEDTLYILTAVKSARRLSKSHLALIRQIFLTVREKKRNINV